mmetsp:Transcript_8398/g.34334  ORF Transcript_8398/g.34334 Transcript_8398/m.34334 type:complete len:221 (-) Transcript_8398:423-1085(-)
MRRGRASRRSTPRLRPRCRRGGPPGPRRGASTAGSGSCGQPRRTRGRGRRARPFAWRRSSPRAPGRDGTACNPPRAAATPDRVHPERRRPIWIWRSIRPVRRRRQTRAARRFRRSGRRPSRATRRGRSASFVARPFPRGSGTARSSASPPARRRRRQPRAAPASPSAIGGVRGTERRCRPCRSSPRTRRRLRGWRRPSRRWRRTRPGSTRARRPATGRPR